MYDAVLIGHGPAAVSAALYLVRAGFRPLLVGGGQSSLMKAERIENYYGLKNGLTGKELFENGLAQAQALGAVVADDEIFGVDADPENGGFAVHGKAADYRGRTVLLATGAGRKAPAIPGLKEYEGLGVSYCAVCDGFFFRGKEVAVLGAGDYALHEASVLLPFTSGVTLLTDGKPEPETLLEGLSADTGKIARFSGEMTLEEVCFADGRRRPFAGVFVALGVASAADLAKKAGIVTKGQYLAVDEDMQTNVPGIYAAGDCVGGVLQVAKAVSDGAAAGLSMSRALRKLRAAQAPEFKAAEL